MQALQGVSIAAVEWSRAWQQRFNPRGFGSSSFVVTCARQSRTWELFRDHRGRLFQKMNFWCGIRTCDNESLIEMLKNSGIIRSKRVQEVMELVDRALFVPKGEKPYIDEPMAIGYNATISAPHMHAECLELLNAHLQPGNCALDVGSGTGILTAAFALLVGDQGRAIGIEHIKELSEKAVANVKKSKAAPFLASGCLAFHVGDGREGWPEAAPYDAIHVGAAAESVPKALIDQLRAGGRMVIPVGDVFQDLKVIDKLPDGSLKESTITAVKYVPLTSRTAQLKNYTWEGGFARGSSI